MTPERWQQIKQIFQAAVELSASEQRAFLDAACVEDPSLRAEVESLLADRSSAANFIETSAFEILGEALPDTSGESYTERRLGAYRILREIGRGGMGVVYRAVRADDEYQKQVAIKLIKRGMDTEFIVQRFRHERQILANLDHPNITKLLDGGTTEDNLPYLVMDYVEGLPINVYCDTHKLSLVERLHLFRTVCSAVHYAHQNLVVHRDLKPSNILITADGVPKLLDFGIAKLLNTDTLYQTRELMLGRLMTPEYASPEQVRGEAITTASDVYSLGVLLYQLLTGHLPYQFKNHLPHEIERIIGEAEPEKPSAVVGRIEEVSSREEPPATLHRQLAGDLDNIVLMALRKEPRRRYASAQEFSEDILRHLEGRPVIARKATPLYRSAKFIQRNKLGVLAAALVVMTLLGCLMATAWQARVARVQKAKAERRFNDVHKLANSFLFEFHKEVEKFPGSIPLQKLMVQRALEYLNSLAKEASDDPALQRDLAAAYEKVGDIQGNAMMANLGDTAGALESYRKALAIREALAAADSTSARARRDLAVDYSYMGELLARTGDAAASLTSLRKALTLFEAVWAADPKNRQAQRDLSIVYALIADRLARTGDTAGALENHRKALAMREALAAADPKDRRAPRDVSVALLRVGDMLARTDDLAGALEHHRKALAIREALAAADPENEEARRDLAIGYDSVGETLGRLGDTAGALEHHRKAFPIVEALAATDPKNALLRRSLSIMYIRFADMLVKSGDTAGALASYRKALSIREALATADSKSAQARRDLYVNHIRIGDLLAESGDRVGALKTHRQALAISEPLAAADPKNMEAQSDLAISHYSIGQLLAAAGDEAGALAHHRQALTIRESLAAADPKNAKARHDLTRSYQAIGDILAKTGDEAGAQAAYRKITDKSP